MISVIIIDYKSMDKTIQYIKHFIANVLDKDNINFIIIDNTQGNDNYNKLKNYNLEQIPYIFKYKDFDDYNAIEKIDWYLIDKYNLITVKSKKNLGYAKGNNLGALLAKRLFNAKYYIFSNNDLIIPEPISINTLIKPFKLSKNIAVVGPKIVNINGKVQSPRKKSNIWKQVILYNFNILLFNTLYKFINNIDYNNESKYAYWVTGCFMIVDSKKFHEVNMFDEKTFLYAEEMILSERLIKRNYFNYFLNDVKLIHYHGQTINSTFNLIKLYELSYQSNYYYFKEYIKCNKFELFVARLSFSILKFFLHVKLKLKSYKNLIV